VQLLDTFGRVHTDLRVSLTDRCNLRCTYCMPAEGLSWLAKPELLTDDEVLRLVRVAVGLGIREVSARRFVPSRGAGLGCPAFRPCSGRRRRAATGTRWARWMRARAWWRARGRTAGTPRARAAGTRSAPGSWGLGAGRGGRCRGTRSRRLFG